MDDARICDLGELALFTPMLSSNSAVPNNDRNAMSREFVQLPAAHPPVLMVVIDTEEEFAWGKGFHREATQISAIAEIHRFQSICDDLGIAPCYVIDYPICSQPGGIDALGPIAADGRCEIGAHLHPWVNPPFTETVNAHNSYPGNLDPKLERAKCLALRDCIETNFGARPISYKAGRYGIGPNTAQILIEAGFEVDLSIASGFNFSKDGGPDFTHHPVAPYRDIAAEQILHLPTTGGFSGLLGPGWAATAYAMGAQPLLQSLRWRGILSRLGLAHQTRLSPEGYSLDENCAFTRDLLRRGIRVFSYSFHSPSLKPGCTSYTRSPAQVDEFLVNIRNYLEFFLGELNGQVVTPTQARDLLIKQ